MIIVVAKARVKAGKSQLFVQAAQDCIRNTRKETGNRSYTLTTDTDDPQQFIFLEEWEHEDALKQHTQTSHFLEFGKGIEDLLAEPLSIAAYRAEHVNL